MHKRTPSWLAVQSNGFRYGFLFSVPCEFEIESVGQMPSAFVGCQVMDSAPKVEHVAGGSAGRMETLEDILAQVNGVTESVFEKPLIMLVYKHETHFRRLYKKHKKAQRGTK